MLRRVGTTGSESENPGRRNRPYSVWTFLPGANLGQILGLRSQSPRILSYAEAIALGLGLLRPLSIIHGASLVQCDLNPANVQISPEAAVSVLDLDGAT